MVLFTMSFVFLAATFTSSMEVPETPTVETNDQMEKDTKNKRVFDVVRFHHGGAKILKIVRVTKNKNSDLNIYEKNLKLRAIKKLLNSLLREF